MVSNYLKLATALWIWICWCWIGWVHYEWTLFSFVFTFLDHSVVLASASDSALAATTFIIDMCFGLFCHIFLKNLQGRDPNWVGSVVLSDKGRGLTSPRLTSIYPGP